MQSLRKLLPRKKESPGNLKTQFHGITYKSSSHTNKREFLQSRNCSCAKPKLQSFGHLMRRVDSLERLWCWEGLGAGGEGDDRGWDGWMASPTRWMWVWVNSGSWWWTGRPGVLRFMGSQRVGQDWATELNWTESKTIHRNCKQRSHLDLFFLVLLHWLASRFLCKSIWDSEIISSAN